jgi:hypothetical protein
LSCHGRTIENRTSGLFTTVGRGGKARNLRDFKHMGPVAFNLFGNLSYIMRIKKLSFPLQ